MLQGVGILGPQTLCLETKEHVARKRHVAPNSSLHHKICCQLQFLILCGHERLPCPEPSGGLSGLCGGMNGEAHRNGLRSPLHNPLESWIEGPFFLGILRLKGIAGSTLQSTRPKPGTESEAATLARPKPFPKAKAFHHGLANPGGETLAKSKPKGMNGPNLYQKSFLVYANDPMKAPAVKV